MTQPDAPDESEEGEAHPHVPAGTWASESAESPLEPETSSQRARSVDGRSSGTIPVRELLAQAPRSATASASPREAATLPARPPYLASELLRQRDERREPIAVPHGRLLSGVGGAALVAGVAALAATGAAGVGPALWLAAALGFVLVVLAAVPVPESKRSLAVLAVAAPLTLLTSIARADLVGAVAIASAFATNAGLVLRSRRIGSWTARAMVAAGAGLAVAWLLAIGIEGATVARLEAAAFVHPAISLMLVVHLGLTLLAFVDDHGRSGSGLIAALGLAWALAEGLAAADLALWPPGARGLTALAPSLTLPAAAVALAQVLGGRPAGAKAVPPANASRSLESS